MLSLTSKGIYFKRQGEEDFSAIPQKIDFRGPAYIPLCRNKKDECELLAKKGKHILAGEILAVCGKNPVCSPVSGVFGDIEYRRVSGGIKAPCAVISSVGSEVPARSFTADDITNRIIDTSDGRLLCEKIDKARGKAAYIIGKAADNQPFVSCEISALIHYGDDAADGMSLIADMLNIDRGKCSFKINAAFAGRSAGFTDIKGYPVTEYRAVYPDFHREENVFQISIQTLVSFNRYIYFNQPQSHVIVTVSDENESKNVLAPVGITVGELLHICGISKKGCIVAGGCMTGFKADPGTPVTPDTRAVTVCEPSTRSYDCIGCARCSDVCPADNIPLHIMRSMGRGKVDLYQKDRIERCILCGCCSYVCPSGIDLTGIMRKAKAQFGGGKDE